MNPFEMVIGIILIVTIGNVLKARYGGRRSRHGGAPHEDDVQTAAEGQRLKSEIASLKERIAVLERVVTENEGSLRLDREIEKLRDARHD